jgi:polysaccharide biosynthesis protein PslH
MDILFVVPYVPSLIRVRPYNLIRSLVKRGNRVTVLTLWSDDRERESLEGLYREGISIHAVRIRTLRSLWNCLGALPSGRPLQYVYSWTPALAKTIQRLAFDGRGKSAFDVVHVEHLRGAQYGISIRSVLKRRKIDLPIVWDSVDSISHLFRQAAVRSRSPVSRWITLLELARTEKYEPWLAGQFDRVLVTSKIDKNAFLSLLPPSGGGDPISILPNGVDLDYFSPDRSVHRDESTIVISGKMSYHANVTMVLNFINEIMPYVWELRRDVRVSVVGKDPPKVIKDLARNPNVLVTGTVPDIRPFLRKAGLSVSPIAYGAGIQNKVLEAMACETPVIASSQAVSALDVQPGKDVAVADGAHGFARMILDLLEDGERRRQLGLSGRLYVEKNHNWDAVAARLEKIYSEVVFPEDILNGAGESVRSIA